VPVIGLAEVLVKPSFKGMQQSIGRELSGLDSQGAKAGRDIGGGVASGIKAATGMIGGAIVAVGIGKFVAEAVRASDATDKFKATMNFAGIDTSGVDAATKAAKAYADATVYDLPTIQNMLAQLASNGVKDYKGLTEAAGNLNAVAGGSADTFKSVAMVMTQTAGAGKLTTENWNQLSDAIPGAAGPLMKAMQEAGAYTGNFRDAMADGQITSDEFNAALMKLGTKPVAVEAAKSTKTFEGAVGNLQATINGGLMTALDAIKPAATTAVTALSDGLGKAMEWTSTAAQGLYDLFVKDDFSGALHKAFGWEEDSPFVTFLFDAKDALYQLWAGLTMNADVREQFGAQLADWVKAGAGIRGAFDGAVSIFGDVAKKLWEFRDPIVIISGLIVASLIPHWVALGVEATASAAKQAQAWATSKGAAVKGAFTHSWAVVVMVAGWVSMAAAAVSSGAITAAIWAMYQWDSIKAVAAMAVARVAIIGSWIAMAAQATIQAVKMAAAWFIALGPVGWIIGIIAALVAGFVWAYNNVGWFKDGVDAALKAVGGFFNWLWTDVIKPVFDGIAAVIDWVYNSVIKPAFDGISAAVKFVGDVFTAFYNTSIKPIFDSAAVIIGGFYLFFRGIFQLVVSVIQNIVIPLFKFFWDRMVEAFAGIGNTISGWWNAAVGIFNGAIGFIRDVFAAVFTWLHDVVIKPVFDAIGTAVRWVWDNVIKPTFDAWVNVFTVVIPDALNWLYANVIKPVFDAIGAAINWVWNNVIKPVFDALVGFINNELAPRFTWLYQNIIKPAFDNIGGAIKWVWDNVIKPVFDTLSNFITKTIPDAFNSGVGFIKTAWDKLQEIAKAPVRFVVDTVINDGLIGAFNTVAGFLPGVDKLPRVALPKGFMTGGYTGDGAKDEPKGVVHGGEFVFTKRQTKKGGVRNLYALAKSLDGYANGGFVNPLKSLALTQGYNRIHKGVDFAAGVGTPVFATENGRVSWSGPGVKAGNVWGGNEIHIDGQSGIQEWFAHLSSMAVRVGDMVRAGQQIGLSGNTGITSGPHLHFGTFAGGWPNDVNPLGYLSGAGVPSGGGFNPLAGILDGLLSTFRGAFPAGGFIADMAIGVGKKLFSTVTDLITGGHGSAAGPALYDLGGVLPPGVSQVVNRTGKPEAILNPQQWADVSRIATQGGGRGDTNFYGNVGWDPHEVADRIETKRRDTFAAFGI
jgi:tape measure domain-containing protein